MGYPQGRAWALIPAFNEEERIEATVEAAGQVPGVDAVWVIDDGSRDATARRARRSGARVLSLPRNYGKGTALTIGLRYMEADVIVFIDADLGASAAGVAPLLEAVGSGDADLAIGDVDPTASSQGWGMARRLAAWGLYRRCGLRLSSPLSGQRALRARFVDHILPLAPGWGVEVGMTWDLFRAGGRIVEKPIALQHRVTRRDWAGMVHRARQMKDIAWALAGRRVRLPEPLWPSKAERSP